MNRTVTIESAPLSIPADLMLLSWGELLQEAIDQRTLIGAYQRQLAREKAARAELETELSCATYEKLRWQAQARRAARPVLVGLVA